MRRGLEIEIETSASAMIGTSSTEDTISIYQVSATPLEYPSRALVRRRFKVEIYRDDREISSGQTVSSGLNAFEKHAFTPKGAIRAANRKGLIEEGVQILQNARIPHAGSLEKNS